ncbi:hypothetical protein EIE95_01235, partial [Campylobacter jejuni]|nr:hypothetical protein [Campylobacter jejuni]EAI1692265.1 hypothetical protein [Campylobacter jejuni]EAI5029102.1 hypothetical protein [Campylobacter coli]EAJ8253314.1 hypothetical protein [Campylobacter coli]
MLYFIIIILIVTIGLFVYSGFRIKSKLIKIATNDTLTKQDLKEIEAISKYYEISLMEAAKIHYGKAMITEEMILRLERPYRELYEQCKNFSTNKHEKISHYLSSNNQDNYLEAINFILIAEESVSIALKSKNKDTAESRRKLALEMEQKIQERHPKAYGLIIDTIQLLEDNYDVSLFENQCIKYYEEAGKLKTIKSKQKRIDCINDLIKEAEANPKIDRKFVD